MTLNFRSITIASLLALSSVPANALIIDNNTYTTDTVSGLDWLDVTASVNRSYFDVSSQFGVGGDFEGWRYASGVELNTLISNAGGKKSPIFNKGKVYQPETNNISVADTLVTLLGSTGDTQYLHDHNQTWDDYYGYDEGAGLDWTSGYILDTVRQDTHYVARLYDADMYDSTLDYTDPYSAVWYANSHFYSMGSYLVRDSTNNIPEPATLSLLGLGLAGLGFARRQKKS
jgi:hypothetical protein